VRLPVRTPADSVPFISQSLLEIPEMVTEIALMMEAVSASEMSVNFYEITSSNAPEVIFQYWEDFSKDQRRLKVNSITILHFVLRLRMRETLPVS
jgi:hypothetical protein